MWTPAHGPFIRYHRCDIEGNLCKLLKLCFVWLVGAYCSSECPFRSVSFSPFLVPRGLVIHLSCMLTGTGSSLQFVACCSPPTIIRAFSSATKATHSCPSGYCASDVPETCRLAGLSVLMLIDLQYTLRGVLCMAEVSEN